LSPLITGRTQVAGLIGDPVRHSLSPAILNAAFAAAGADWVFVAFEVPAGEAGAAIEATRTLGIGGLSVTMPHKSDVAAAVDDLTPAAAALGAVNCVSFVGGRLLGDNTDADGFVDALRIDEGFDPAGARCVVVGAGGAGRAVVWALGRAGAADVAIINRSSEPATRAAGLAGTAGRVGTEADLADADLVVNATPLGMGVVVATDGSPEPLPLAPELLAPGQLLVDLVYHPSPTPLLIAARQRGVSATGGLGMLIHQAAHAFRRWTNEDPSLEAMSAAAMGALAAREGSAHGPDGPKMD
jgi:shikimate dehydrogenase